MADFVIMCRDSDGLTGIEWVQMLASQGVWGLNGAGPASSMKPDDRGIFYWTTKRLFVAHCTIGGPSVPLVIPAPALLMNSRYQFPLADLTLWEHPLSYGQVKSAGMRIPFLPSSVFPLNPGQFEELLALAHTTATVDSGSTDSHGNTWDAEFAQAIATRNQKVRGELRQKLLHLDSGDFEELIGHLLVALGFDGVEVTRRSGDGGIDVRGVLIVAGSIRIRMAVQVKRWQNNVQAPVVQQVRGSLGAHEQGLIITTSGFSPGARNEASRADATPVALIDGEQLVGLLVANELGVTRTNYVALGFSSF